MSPPVPHCHRCRTELTADQRYCVSCGTPVAGSLPWLRRALADPRGHRQAPRPRRTRGGSLLAGWWRARRLRVGASLTSGAIGVGILFGALVSPVANVVAAPLVALGLAPANSSPTAGSTPALAAAGAPAAPPAAVPAPATIPPAGASSPVSSQAANTVTTTETSTDDATSTDSSTTAAQVKLPAIKHVWVVVLSDQSLNSLFGPTSPATYLMHTLVPEGTLLNHYHAVAHGALADTVAMISGQGPTPELQANCPTYTNLAPGTVDSTGFAHGHGCVFPWNAETFVGVQDLPDLLTPYHLTWRAYIGGQSGTATAPLAARDPVTTTTTTTSSSETDTTSSIETTTSSSSSSATSSSSSSSLLGLPLPNLPVLSPTSSTTTTAASPTATATPAALPAGACSHPALGAADPSAGATPAANGYATRRNPFAYFHSTDDKGACATTDVGLDQLGRDLSSGQAASFSWVAPDLCSAGDPTGCPAGTVKTGAAAADAFLATWIPKIMATPAYKQSGMIVIVPDEAPASGTGADSSACCGTLKYANTSNPGDTAVPGPGGGLTGALVLSPFAAKRAVDPTPYDHYSLLRTIEDLFKVTPALGYAAKRTDFGAQTFPSESGGGDQAVTTRVHAR